MRRVKFFKKSKLVSLIIYQYFFSTTKIKMRCFMEHTSLLRSISSKGPVMIFRRGQGGRISVGITWSSDRTEKELVVGTENIGRTTVNGLPTNCQSGRGGGSVRILQSLMRGSGQFSRDATKIFQPPSPPRINNDRSLSDLVQNRVHSQAPIFPWGASHTDVFRDSVSSKRSA